MEKTHLLIVIFLLESSLFAAGENDTTLWRASDCVHDYMLFSRLGPGYSRNMSDDVIFQFSSLFTRDAWVSWDLNRTPADSLPLSLPVAEYIEMARHLYFPKQPVLEYPRIKIRIREDGLQATVFIRKVNNVMGEKDQPEWKHKIKLRMTIDLAGKDPLISGIIRDDRPPVVEGLTMTGNYIIWSETMAALTNDATVVLHTDQHCQQTRFSSTPEVQFGGLTGFRLNRERPAGVILTTGLFYSSVTVSAVMTAYIKSNADTLDRTSPAPLACTTFERSGEISEQTTLSRYEIPLLMKIRLNRWSYLNVGPALDFVYGSSMIRYTMNRTGGGEVTNLATGDKFLLDEEHEIDLSVYGYYRNKQICFPKDELFSGALLSLKLGFGFEKQAGDFSFALEPNISLGMNSLTGRNGGKAFTLTTPAEYHSMLLSADLPSLDFTVGIKLLISCLFRDHHG